MDYVEGFQISLPPQEVVNRCCRTRTQPSRCIHSIMYTGAKSTVHIMSSKWYEAWSIALQYSLASIFDSQEWMTWFANIRGVQVGQRFHTRHKRPDWKLSSDRFDCPQEPSMLCDGIRNGTIRHGEKVPSLRSLLWWRQQSWARSGWFDIYSDFQTWVH